MITEPVPVAPHDTPKPRRSRRSARSLILPDDIDPYVRALIMSNVREHGQGNRCGG